MFLDSRSVCWSSKRQPNVALFSIESEVAVATEDIPLDRLLQGFDTPVSLATLYCDSQPVFTIQNASG